MAALVPARLDFHDETPYSAAFGDVYHSTGGGPAQARHVFLAGNALPERWAQRERFVILEAGFGFGLNFLATWHAWKRDPSRCRRLHYVSIEKHPFTAADLRTLHQRYPELAPEASELHAHWPLLVSGAHRLEFGNVVLSLFFGDVAMLHDLRLAADAVYLDGFAPAKNPEMWTHQTMRAVSRLTARDATVATWSVAGRVGGALEATGFAVEKRAGFGGKREMLVGRSVKSVPDPALPKERKATVIGAGLAGAGVCARLCGGRWDVELHGRSAEPAQEASGNHAGTFHPIVTPDDSIFARLTRAAYLYGLRNWQRLGSARYDQCGVLQLARTDKEMEAQRKSVAGLPAAYAQFVEREEATAHAGVPVAAPGLWFAESGWIKPRSLVRAQLDACGERLQRHFASPLEKIPEGTTVILANSAEAPELCAVPHLRLRRVRGQLTYVPIDALEPPRTVVLRGGMVLPPIDGVCVVGATYDLEDADAAVREDSHAGNLERLRNILGVEVKAKTEGRVSFRAVTPDRLPVVGKITDGVYAAFAYGSRGIIWSALAAEIIARELAGEPRPLESRLARALEPR